jgi:murein DD-endopeptidase MepM/ murein hydrolase activator NlpD
MLLAVPRRVSSVLIPALLLSLIVLASPAGAAPVEHELQAAQRRLDAITERIRVGTAVWLALVRDVRALQADVRHGSRPTSRARLELANIMPGWLAVKAFLHRAYREMKADFVRTGRLTKEILGPPPAAFSRVGRWWRDWPLRLRGTGPVRACPVQGPHSVADSFGAPRPGGRIHEGNDVFAATGTPVIAVADGVVIREPNTLGGQAVVLRTGAGYFYYAHLSAFGASGRVRAGDVIGLTGTSGDANGLIPQVHFEYHPGGGPAVDPFPVLQPAC